MNKKWNDKRGPEYKTSITGILTAGDWDDNHNLISVKLSSNDEEEYLIENWEEFKDILQRSIQAIGIIEKNRKGENIIFIKKYKILDEDFQKEF